MAIITACILMCRSCLETYRHFVSACETNISVLEGEGLINTRYQSRLERECLLPIPITKTLLIQADYLEAHLPQSKQWWHIWQHRVTPRWISLMWDDHVLFMGWDRFIKNLMIIILLWRCEVVLAGTWITQDNDIENDNTHGSIRT